METKTKTETEIQNEKYVERIHLMAAQIFAGQIASPKGFSIFAKSDVKKLARASVLAAMEIGVAVSIEIDSL